MRELPLSAFEGTDKPNHRLLKVLAYDSMSAGDAVQSVPVACQHLKESLRSGERLAFLPGINSIAAVALLKVNGQRIEVALDVWV